PDLAVDEWRRMTLSNHTRHYPSIWEGTLSGPDAYNGVESSRPGRTWSVPEAGLGMQAFPVANLHSHAQPLLAYLRLLGVEPRPDGGLAVGGPASAGSSLRTPTLRIEADGHGRLSTVGPVALHTQYGTFSGGGDLTW
nr:hypothetical protein [Micromonospora sp. DSM 115978]